MAETVPYDGFADIYDAWCESAPVTARNKAFYVELMTDSPGPRGKSSAGTVRAPEGL